MPNALFSIEHCIFSLAFLSFSAFSTYFYCCWLVRRHSCADGGGRRVRWHSSVACVGAFEANDASPTPKIGDRIKMSRMQSLLGIYSSPFGFFGRILLTERGEWPQ